MRGHQNLPVRSEWFTYREQPELDEADSLFLAARDQAAKGETK